MLPLVVWSQTMSICVLRALRQGYLTEVCEPPRGSPKSVPQCCFVKGRLELGLCILWGHCVQTVVQDAEGGTVWEVVGKWWHFDT